MKNLDKKKDIIELIRWYALQPEQRDSVIPGFVKAILLTNQKKEDPKKVASTVWEKVSKDDFIEQFIPSFDKFFSHEEIKDLLSFYKSDIMKKMNTTGKDIFIQIFTGFNKTIKEVLES